MAWFIALTLISGGIGLSVLSLAANAHSPNSDAGLNGFFAGAAAAIVGAVIAIGLLVIMLFGPTPAAAQQLRCMPWTELSAALAENHGEVPIGGGIVSRHSIIQVLAAEDGASFTIAAVNRSGMACLLATGTDWEVSPPPSGKET